MIIQTQASKPKLAGFSLIELMITVAIVGILGTIATAAYTSQMQRSRRTDARTALMDTAGREEKLFTTNNAYSNSPVALGIGSATSFPTAGLPVGSGYYNVTVAAPDNTQTPAQGFLITAKPVSPGPQTADAACTSLTVNQLGVQGSTGTGTVAACWGTGT